MTPRPASSQNPSHDPSDTAASPSRSVAGLLLRAWWMLLGNGVLVLVLAVMAFERSALPSRIDAAFAALVASLLVARFADVRWFGGVTADGARATREHVRRYALRLLGGSAAGWGVANAAALL